MSKLNDVNRFSMNNVSEVVNKGWCVGCGMCAALCPKSRLEIRFNERGGYAPFEIEEGRDCISGCSICLEVCPAHGTTKNESELGWDLYGKLDGMRHTAETGHYLASYVGYSKKGDQRLNGASGGLATWVLETLLESGEVDTVACVKRTGDPGKLFEFAIYGSIEEVRACSRSAYYPVEISGVIQHILKNNGSFAVIGLPCVCKSIRLAQRKFPKLRQRIKYVLGLICGHQCTKYFSEYICTLGGGDPHNIRDFIFRDKDLTQSASNLAFSFTTGGEETITKTRVFWRDGVDEVFKRGYFQLMGCYFCDDIFAECADISFMDAWLPEYSVQPEGHSLILTRSLKLDAAIRSASDDQLNLQELKVEKVVESQRGVVEKKRRRFSTNISAPVLRDNLMFDSGVLQASNMRTQMEISQSSSMLWSFCDKDLSKFSQMIQPLLTKFNRQKRVLKLTRKVLSWLKRVIEGVRGKK